MKRILFSLLACLLAISLVGCGTYNPAVKPPKDNPQTPEDGTTPPDESPPTEAGETFTVSLEYKGEPYRPQNAQIFANWSNGFTTPTTAQFDAAGKATATLDGDYKVTLSGLPDDMTYNPNIYTVSNTQRDVTIELHQIRKTSGAGDKLYNCIKLSNVNFIYRTTLKRKSSVVYYEFVPPSNGVYSIESWVETNNLINPIVTVYKGTAAKFVDKVVDDGGISDIYTKNFRHEFYIADEEIGNTFTFAIKADSKTDVFPTYVDFVLRYEGEHHLTHIDSNMMVPDDLYEEIAEAIDALIPLSLSQLKALPAADGFADAHMLDISKRLNTLATWQKGDIHDTMTLHGFLSDKTAAGEYFPRFLESHLAALWAGDGLWTDPERYEKGFSVFDGDMYRYCEATGFYHLYDEATYADSSYGYGYGPILYAKITQNTRFSNAFNGIEYAGNKALTVNEGTQNYKLFIEGYQNICDTLLALGYGGTDFGCPETLYHMFGYADFANHDGAVPVTPEIKNFLQSFSCSQRYFMDGEGWVETHPNYSIDAQEDDQWLFACGYYAPIEP